MDTLAGIGLRQPHYDALLAAPPPLDFVEVHSENFFADGGAALAVLEAARAQWPVSLHGVGLALGSAAGLDAWHLHKLAALVRRIEPVRVSDHASYARAPRRSGGPVVHGSDLLPIAFTDAALDILVANVQRVQDALARPLLVENLSAYLHWADDVIAEPEFFNALARRSGCGLLLDVNNLVVNALNDRGGGLAASVATEGREAAAVAVQRHKAAAVAAQRHEAAAVAAQRHEAAAVAAQRHEAAAVAAQRHEAAAVAAQRHEAAAVAAQRHEAAAVAAQRHEAAAVAAQRHEAAAVAAQRHEAAAVAAACRWIDALDPASVGEIHLAGYDDGGELVIDDHGSRVRAPVWQVFRHAVRRLGRRPTLVEWDTDVPALEVLLGEAQRAARETAAAAAAGPRS